MATSITQYGITWTWAGNLTTGQFANGDYYVVAPSGLTLTGITPETAIIGGRRANGSMVNPTPGNYTSQGFDASLLSYSDSLNIALVGGTPLSVSNTRSVPAGSSICTVISSASGDRGAVREAFTDFAVLTVLASTPAAGSFRPPYTGTNKSITWNKSQLNYGILRNLTPVAGMSAPTSGNFVRPWMEIEMDYNQARSWHPNSNQPEYDRDMGYSVTGALLELHQNYSNAAKEIAYVRIVQYGIDVYGQVKNGIWNILGTNYTGIQANSQTKPALVLAALALDDADMKTYVDGPNSVTNPYAWSGSQPRFYADAQMWYVDTPDVGRSLNVGNQQYVEGAVGTPEWGQEHWGDRNKDNAAWGAAYRDVRYGGQVGMALGMQLTVGARELWNNQVYFDYFDRAFAIYSVSGADPTLPYVKLFWNANRSLGGTGQLPDPICSLANAGSPRSTYNLDSPRAVTFSEPLNVGRIFYTFNGSEPVDGVTGTNFLYNSASKPSVTAAMTLKWRAFGNDFTPSVITSISISFVPSGHPCAPVALSVS